MTNPMLAEWHDLVHERLTDAGLADHGEYRAPGSDIAIPCRCYLRRDVQAFGEFGQAIAPRTVLQLLRADVPEPRLGSTVTLGAEVFTLDAVDLARPNDEAVASFVVTP